MYLEERIEQVEALSEDQGRQIETIAKGLDDLTVTVNNRFDRVDERFRQIDERFDRVEADIAELKSGQVRLEVAVTDIQKTQQLILTILQDRLQ